MKKPFLKGFMLAVAAVCLIIAACANDREEDSDHPAAFPELDLASSDQIPILAWYSIFGVNTTLANYQDLAAAGFTHNLSFPTGETDIAKSFEYAEKVGVKILLYVDRSWTTEDQVRERVNRYKDHPSLFGYFLYDEIAEAKFSELAEQVRFVQDLDPAHPCYVNLFPNILNPFYREYVDNFIKKVPVPMLSFDHYPVLGKDDVSPVRHLRPEWYENLEVISAAAYKSHKPFWAFALSTAHSGQIGNTPPFHQPIPTLADLRLQVFSNLVYGAQGIQYFTYFTPTDGNFHEGPFDKGGKTRTYDTVKEMNQEIKALSGVFLDSKVLSVFHTGNAVPQGTKRLQMDEIPAPVPFSGIETEGPGAVVSFLEKQNVRFMAVVNRDLMGEMKLHMTLKKNARVRKVLKTGIVSAQDMPEAETMTVSPGDIAIFVWPGTE